MEKLLNPDFAQAKKFLKSLDPGSDLHTFQTFDDNADCKKTSLARTLNGTFEEHQDALVQLNNQGAGVFITVQRTDGTGRKKKNIVVIRSFFVEDDSGTGGIALPIEPQITVESSPGKYHRYLLCRDVPLDEFESIQQRLVDDFGSDPCAKDRARVLRLPGFYHQKVNVKKGLTGEPFMVRIANATSGDRYSFSEIVKALPPVHLSDPKLTVSNNLFSDIELENLVRMLSYIAPDSNYDLWIKIGMALKSTKHPMAKVLWESWSLLGDKYRPEEIDYKWDSFNKESSHE